MTTTSAGVAVSKSVQLQNFLVSLCRTLPINTGVQKVIIKSFREKVANGGTFTKGGIVSGLANAREELVAQQEAIQVVLDAWPDGDTIEDTSINTTIHSNVSEQWSIGRFMYDFTKRGNQKCQVFKSIGVQLNGE